jgi:succinate dehydrogenase / fumarate reductase iron-sulfur subunit
VYELRLLHEACLSIRRRESSTSVKRTSSSKAQKAAFDQNFIGAAVISQAVLLILTQLALHSNERMEALSGPAESSLRKLAKLRCGLPQEYSLTTSIGRAGRAATVYSFKKLFNS